MHICFHEKPHMIFKYLKYHKIRPLALYCCICLIVVVVCPFHCGSRSLSSTLSGFAYTPPPPRTFNPLPVSHHTRNYFAVNCLQFCHCVPIAVLSFASNSSQRDTLHKS